MRVLVDTDVILDFLLERPGFVDNAQAIWEANSRGDLDGYIAAITPINVFYLARKLKGIDTARLLVNEMLSMWRICPVDDLVLKAAVASGLSDYEDAVQQASAHAQGIEVLVTRNLSDYRQATIEVLSPQEFLSRLTSQ